MMSRAPMRPPKPPRMDAGPMYMVRSFSYVACRGGGEEGWTGFWGCCDEPTVQCTFFGKLRTS